jgi:hypothetical protein
MRVVSGYLACELDRTLDSPRVDRGVERDDLGCGESVLHQTRNHVAGDPGPDEHWIPATD